MKNKLTWIIAGYYLLHYITMGVYSPYVNVYYERIGFNGSQIGMISLVGLICAMICAPIFGMLCDKTKNEKAVISGLMLLAGASMLVWRAQTEFVYVLITATLLLIFRSDIGSLADSLSVKICNRFDMKFSFIRAIGSLGYLVGAFVIANILNMFGEQGPYVGCYVLCMVLGAILVWFFPKAESETSKEKVSITKDGLALLKNKDFIFITIVMIFTTMILDCAVAYAGNHLVATLEQPDSIIGIFSCAMVLPEVFLVMYINTFVKKLGLKKVYILACISQIIRLLVYAFSNNIILFLVASTLHGIMIGVGTVGNVEFMYKRIDRKMLSTAMSLYNATYTITTALSSQVFGWIYQYGSSNMIFLISAVLTCIPLVMITTSKRFSE